MARHNINAAEILRRVEPSNSQALEALITLIRGNDKEASSLAYSILFHIKPKETDILNSLAQLLQKENDDVRLHAALIFRSIRPTEQQLKSALIAGLSDKNAQVRGALREALNLRHSDPLVLRPLIKLLQDNDIQTREAAYKDLKSQSNGTQRTELTGRKGYEQKNAAAPLSNEDINAIYDIFNMTHDDN